MKVLDEASVIESQHPKHTFTQRVGKDTEFEVPIDEFGSKILANLGWKKGFGIGRHA